MADFDASWERPAPAGVVSTVRTVLDDVFATTSWSPPGACAAALRQRLEDAGVVGVPGGWIAGAAVQISHGMNPGV
jgi:hypothetical protein